MNNELAQAMKEEIPFDQIDFDNYSKDFNKKLKEMQKWARQNVKNTIKALEEGRKATLNSSIHFGPMGSSL